MAGDIIATAKDVSRTSRPFANIAALTASAYNFPNDESEQDRLDLNHHLCLTLLDDKLHLAPLPTDRPLRILDVGTGTGIWAMDIADQYPTSEVVRDTTSQRSLQC
jgi:methylase of polypeptide subunit release factors